MKKRTQTISLFLATAILSQSAAFAQTVQPAINMDELAQQIQASLGQLTPEQKAEVEKLQQQLKNVQDVLNQFEALNNKINAQEKLRDSSTVRGILTDASNKIDFAIAVTNVISTKVHLSNLEKGKISAVVSGLTAVGDLIKKALTYDVDHPTPEVFQKIINDNMSQKDVEQISQMTKDLSSIVTDLAKVAESTSSFKITKQDSMYLGVALDVANIMYATLVFLTPSLSAADQAQVQQSVSMLKSVLAKTAQQTTQLRGAVASSKTLQLGSVSVAGLPAGLEVLANMTAYNSEQGRTLMLNIIAQLQDKKVELQVAINKINAGKQ